MLKKISIYISFIIVIFLFLGCGSSYVGYSDAILMLENIMKDSSYCFKRTAQNKNRSYKNDWSEINAKEFLEEKAHKYNTIIENYRFCIKDENDDNICFDALIDVPQLRGNKNDVLEINSSLIKIMFTIFFEDDGREFIDALNVIESQNTHCIESGRRFSIELEYDLLFVSDEYISMIISVFSSQGGAHPAYFSEIVTYSVAEDRVIDINKVISEKELFSTINKGKYKIFEGHRYESIDELEELFDSNFIIEHYKHRTNDMYENYSTQMDLIYDRRSPYNFGMDEDYYYIEIHHMRGDAEFDYVYIRVDKV